MPIDYNVRAEKPTLDHYRRDWTPGPGVGSSGMWISAAVTGADGNEYFGLRGADDFVRGMTHLVTPICGFRPLKRTLTEMPAHLYSEYATIDWFEPLQYVDSGDKVTLTFDSGRFERDDEGLHWYDAAGRWEMHGKTASDIVLIHVPEQEGVAQEVYYRHEIIKGHGKINGIEVEGYMHQDYGYGPPGMIYPELPLARGLQSLWVSWLHEYADGTLGGGCFWQGSEGLEYFGPGYVLKDGVTHLYKDISSKRSFHENGKLSGLEFTAGTDTYTMDLNMVESPMHTLGQVTATSFGKAPEKSWCYTESALGPPNPAAADYLAHRYRLVRGK